MSNIPPSTYDDLPPSAKFVYDTLDRDGPLSREELQEQTGLPERTVDRALESLHNGDFIVKTRDSEDLRQVVAKTASMRTYNPSRD